MEDDIPTPGHEIEMGAEDELGHALPGNPNERVATLKARIQYLDGEINKLNTADPDDENVAGVLKTLLRDRYEAEQILKDFQHQQSASN